MSFNGCASTLKKDPAAPPPPSSATAGTTTIVAIAPPARSGPTTTLPELLGLPQLASGICGLAQRLGSRLANSLDLTGRFPELQPQPPLLALTDPANLEPDAPPAVQAAAEIKAEEDAAPQKIMALRYLATIGCGGCYEKVETALLEGMSDCTEAVRYEAVKALECRPDNCCKFCSSSSCCSPAVRKRLEELTQCEHEQSPRVRRAARLALACCMGKPLDEEDVPREGPPAAPLLDAAANASPASEAPPDRVANGNANIKPSANQMIASMVSDMKVLNQGAADPNAFISNAVSTNVAVPNAATLNTTTLNTTTLNTTTLNTDASVANAFQSITAALPADPNGANALPTQPASGTPDIRLAASTSTPMLAAPALTTTAVANSASLAEVSSGSPSTSSSSTSLPSTSLPSVSHTPDVPKSADRLLARVNGREIYASHLRALQQSSPSAGNPVSIVERSSASTSDDTAQLLPTLQRAIDWTLLHQQAQWEILGRVDNSPLSPLEVQAWLERKLACEQFVSSTEVLAWYQIHQDQYRLPSRVRWESMAVDIDQCADRTQAFAVASYLRRKALGEKLPPPEFLSRSMVRAETQGWCDFDKLPAGANAALLTSLPVGELSQVVESDKWLVLYRVIERESGRVQPLATVATKISNDILAERGRVAMSRLLVSLRAGAQIWIAPELLQSADMAALPTYVGTP